MRIQLPNNWRPRHYQLKAWSYLESGGRHAELIYHRRAGKDDLALHWTAVAANDVGHPQSIGRVGNYWHCLPKANQARKALWEAINPHTGRRRIDEAFPPEIRASKNDTEMLIRMKSGSTWQVVGSDNFDSLVGSPPIGLVLSEWALCNPNAWAYLRPIVAENRGWVMMNTTPRGRNHAFRTFQAARADPDHFAELLPASETNVFTEAQLEAERRELIAEYGEDYGEALYEQEYLCSFDAPNLGAIMGKVISKAERSGRISNSVLYDPDGAPVEVSSDIGFRDSSGWWFWQPAVGGYRILGYMGDSGLDAEEWITRLQAKFDEEEWELGRIWLPKDAASKTFRSRNSSLVLFAKAFGEHKVGIVPQAPIGDRINAARVIGARCAFHEAKCEKGLDGLRSWAFRYDEELKAFSKDPVHDWASHPGDAFSYGALIMRERVAEPKKAPKKDPYRGDMVYPDMFGGSEPKSPYRYR
ncbi:MAG: hypothetical protein IT349_19365 [Candidatus Eisenbacteria bacterium]|nr:hypothetical protein [Candidatus Eisenbacteria bacterium]